MLAVFVVFVMLMVMVAVVVATAAAAILSLCRAMPPLLSLSARLLQLRAHLSRAEALLVQRLLQCLSCRARGTQAAAQSRRRWRVAQRVQALKLLSKQLALRGQL